MTYEKYSKLMMVNRLADGRGLASFHCILGLSRGSTYTELDSSGQPRLYTKTLAWYAAVLWGPTCVRLYQHTRWYDASPDRDCFTCCIRPQLFRNRRPSGVLSAPR